jgi:hypothetical protein
MNWTDVNTHPAPYGVWVLIRYYKRESQRGNSAKRFCITEAIIEEPKVIVHQYPNGNVWNQKVGGKWFDYADRLICDTTAKNPRNVVTHWMPMPEEP